MKNSKVAGNISEKGGGIKAYSLTLINSSVQNNESLSDGAYTLTILHNNDGESKLFNLGENFENYGGLKQIASVVEWERNYIESNNDGNNDVIMVSSGDKNPYLADRI